MTLLLQAGVLVDGLADDLAQALQASEGGLPQENYLSVGGSSQGVPRVIGSGLSIGDLGASD